jgi:hypothetical protein
MHSFETMHEFLLGLLSILLLVACSSSVNVSKRQYRKGYFIEFLAKREVQTKQKQIVSNSSLKRKEKTQLNKLSLKTNDLLVFENSKSGSIRYDLPKSEILYEIEVSKSVESIQDSIKVKRKLNSTVPRSQAEKNIFSLGEVIMGTF